MNRQTETYITLKPIADRFSKVASEITDSEIKVLIKDVMREKIAESLDFDMIAEIAEDFIEKNQESICEAIKAGIIQRLELPRDYKYKFEW